MHSSLGCAGHSSEGPHTRLEEKAVLFGLDGGLLEQAGPWREIMGWSLCFSGYTWNTGRQLGIKLCQDPRVGERKRVGKQVTPSFPSLQSSVPRWAGACGDGLDLALSSLSVCLLSLSVLGSCLPLVSSSPRQGRPPGEAEGREKSRSGRSSPCSPPPLPCPEFTVPGVSADVELHAVEAAQCVCQEHRGRASPASSTPATPSCSSPP